MSVKGLFEKFEMKQEGVTVSDASKIDLPIMAFVYLPFCGQCLIVLHSEQRQKIENTMCPNKTLHVKTSDSQNGQYFSLGRQNNLNSTPSSMCGLLILTIFRAWKITCNFFRGHLTHCCRHCLIFNL